MLQPIILAAGKGTRLQSELPKTLYPVLGAPMLQRILDTLASVSMLPPIIVIGHKGDMVKKVIGPAYQYVEQQKLTGTASAVETALPCINPQATGVLVLYGDQPFVRKKTIEKIIQIFSTEHPAFIQTTLTVPDFEDRYKVFEHFGRVVRDAAGLPEKIVEYKNASEKERLLTEVNPGVCCIERKWALQVLPHIVPNPVNAERYLTDMLALTRAAGKAVQMLSLTPLEAVGINSPSDEQDAKLFL